MQKVERRRGKNRKLSVPVYPSETETHLNLTWVWLLLGFCCFVFNAKKALYVFTTQRTVLSFELHFTNLSQHKALSIGKTLQSTARCNGSTLSITAGEQKPLSSHNYLIGLVCHYKQSQITVWPSLSRGSSHSSLSLENSLISKIYGLENTPRCSKHLRSIFPETHGARVSFRPFKMLMI